MLYPKLFYIHITQSLPGYITVYSPKHAWDGDWSAQAWTTWLWSKWEKQAGDLSCHSLPPPLVLPVLGTQKRNGQLTLISSWVFMGSITKEILWQARQCRFGPWPFHIGSETWDWKFSPSQFSLSWGPGFAAGLARLLYQLLSASRSDSLKSPHWQNKSSIHKPQIYFKLFRLTSMCPQCRISEWQAELNQISPCPPSVKCISVKKLRLKDHKSVQSFGILKNLKEHKMHTFP